MRRLYEICQSRTKIWKPLPGGDHNSSVLEDGYFEAVEDFVAILDVKDLDKEREKEKRSSSL